MRCRQVVTLLALAALAGGGWYLVRARIGGTALAGTAHDVPRPHVDQPPHGGTAVVLGDDDFNLELVRDAASGTLRAYLMDGEMEEFIRVADRQLDLEIDRDGRRRTLTLKPVADPVTGETVGDTCLFQAQADWLKQADHFKGVIKRVAIQDRTFKSIPFAFPEGTAKD
jgi:hypothetical protein